MSRSSTALCALLAVLALVVVPRATAGEAETMRYKGHFRGEPGTVSVEVRSSRQGKPRIAIFEAKGFELTCEDDSTEFWPSLTLRARFGRGGRFSGDIWEINSLGSSSFFQKRNISGHLLGLLDREGGGPPDCHSYSNRGPWVAQPVGR